MHRAALFSITNNAHNPHTHICVDCIGYSLNHYFHSIYMSLCATEQCQLCHVRRSMCRRLFVPTIALLLPAYWHAVCRQRPVSLLSHSITAMAIR